MPCIHLIACCTRCQCCASLALRPLRCTTCSTPSSFPGSSMRRQRGRECVWPPTAHVWTRYRAAASDSATVVKTCRPSPTCLTLPTMTYFTLSIQTPTTYYTYLTRSTYLASSKTALIITIINKTKLLNDSDFIVRMLYKHSY